MIDSSAMGAPGPAPMGPPLAGPPPSLPDAMGAALGAGPQGPMPAVAPPGDMLPQGPLPPEAMQGMPAGPGGPPQEQKKPPLILPPRLAKQMAQGYVDQVRAMSQQLADYAGHPDEYQRMSLKDQVSAWYRRDPRHDPLALKDQGLSDAEVRDKVYPLRKILLKLAGPRPKDRVAFARRMKEERAKQATLQE